MVLRIIKAAAECVRILVVLFGMFLRKEMMVSTRILMQVVRSLTTLQVLTGQMQGTFLIVLALQENMFMQGFLKLQGLIR